MEEAIRQAVSEQYAAQVEEQLSALPAEQLAALLTATEWTDAQYALMYDQFMPPAFSEATLEGNYETLGYVDPESPNGVKLYASTFADKDEIANVISSYNDSAAEEDKITYTDYVALLMSSITDIISGISYLLIAFVGISLVVSLHHDRYLSPISRCSSAREIGILRAIGASKRISPTSSTPGPLLVGLTAGLIGIRGHAVAEYPHQSSPAQSDPAGSPQRIPAGHGRRDSCGHQHASHLHRRPDSLPPRGKKDPVVALRTE